jgi:hypothetical protein
VKGTKRFPHGSGQSRTAERSTAARHAHSSGQLEAGSRTLQNGALRRDMRTSRCNDNGSNSCVSDGNLRCRIPRRPALISSLIIEEWLFHHPIGEGKGKEHHDEVALIVQADGRTLRKVRPITIWYGVMVKWDTRLERPSMGEMVADQTLGRFGASRLHQEVNVYYIDHETCNVLYGGDAVDSVV